MGKFDWNKVTREDVEKAIKKFLEDTPEYPMPRSTFLLYDNKKLPAKHIRGMAYKIANGKEISKDDYAGGMETVRFFNKLGFDVFYKDSVITGDTITEKKLGVVSDHNMQAMKLEPVVEERTVEQAVQVKTCIKKKESPNEQKIKIPSKEVIEQKNALQLLLNKYFDGDIVCEKTYSWLKTPDEIAGSYIKIYDALHGLHGDTKFAKKNVTLRCDFVCESRKTIIEYDERQHFSQARLVSLQAYPDDVQLYFDKEFWIKACEDIQAKDNSPVNRDETRAFYDSTRDIECARHGYKLIRIMHGQVDWNQPDALETLKALVGEKADTEEMDTADQKCVAENEPAKAGEIKGKGDYPDIQIKIGLYLQTQTACDKKSFDEAMQVAKMSDFDILVFPEDCYCPRIEEFWNLDITKEEDINTLFDYCVELSESIDKAVVFSAMDSYGTPYSIFANYKSQDDETNVQMYIKHTMAQSSAFDFENYRDLAPGMFEPIIYKGYKIGLTICYDCNHSVFSRMWGKNGVDMIINSTGGDVVFDKWYKYNKARAIENHCYNFVTMGGEGIAENPHTYVYGFNREGKELPFINLMKNTNVQNEINTIYVFDTGADDGRASVERSYGQEEKENKKSNFDIPVGDVSSVIERSTCIKKNLYSLPHGNDNIIFCIADNMDIMEPETVLSLMYAKELKKIRNKKYIIVNRHTAIDEDFFKTKLSTILKVRSMENYCAVIFESNIGNHCYQCGNNRTAQLVKAKNGVYGIDLSRTGGGETIWRDKQGMRASWRDNFEWLIEQVNS